MSRIYESQQAGVNFKGQSRGGSFNPQKAADNTKQLKQEAAAKEQDFRVRAREAARREEMDRLELDGQQRAEASALALGQSMEMNGLMLEQGWTSNNLKIQQDYETAVMNLESSELQARGQVDIAKTQIISSAVQSILSFTNEAIQLPNAIEEAKLRKLKLEEAEAQKASRELNFEILDAKFGPKIEPPESSVERAEADAVRATTTSISNSVKDLTKEGSASSVGAATQLINNNPAIPYGQVKTGVSEVVGGMQGTIMQQINQLQNPPQTELERNTLVQKIVKDYLLQRGYPTFSDVDKRKVMTTLGPLVEQFENAVANRALRFAQANHVGKAETLAVRSINSYTPKSDIRPSIDSVIQGFELVGEVPGEGEKNAMKFIAESARSTGDVEYLEALMGLEKVPGNSGTRYGYVHSETLGPALEGARAVREANAKDAGQRIIVALNDELRAATTQEQRSTAIDQAINRLSQLHDGLGGAFIQDLEDSRVDLLKPAVQATLVAEMKEMIRNGEITSPDIIRTHPSLDADSVGSLITFLDKNSPTIAVSENLQKRVDLFIDGGVGVIDAQLGVKRDSLGNLANIGGGLLAGQNDALLASYIEDGFRQDIQRVAKFAHDTVKDENISDAEKELKVMTAVRTYFEEQTKPGGKYFFDTQSGSFATEQNKNDIYQKAKENFTPTNAARLAPVPFIQDNYYERNLKFESIEDALAGKERYDHSRGDTLFTGDYQKSIADNYASTGQFGADFEQFAKEQGLSPLALLNAQQLRHNEKEVLYNTPAAQSTSVPAGVGVKVLMGKNLARPGAEYLAGKGNLNIAEMIGLVDQMGSFRLNDGTGRTIRDVFESPRSTPRQLTEALMILTEPVSQTPAVKKSPSSPGNQSSGIGEPIYYSGNIGPTSTGPHLDVKKVGRGKFDETALDDFVVVQDPEFGMVSLGDIRNKTGGIGDNWDQHVARGSYGIDYGLHSGTEIFLKNGAKVIGSTPTEHGDMLTIELPNGDQYTFLHGETAKQ